MHESPAITEKYDATPSARIKALASIYFPTLLDLATEVDQDADRFNIEVLTLRHKMISEEADKFQEEADKIDPRDPLGEGGIETSQDQRWQSEA